MQAPEVTQATERTVALWPAIWSAIAASFAAFSSIMLVLIHRRNLLESARPELVLLDWTRTGGTDEREELRFGRIKNVGRGAALHLHINALKHVEREGKKYPVATAGTLSIPILGPNDELKVEQSIVLWWKNAPILEPGSGNRYIMLPITILHWDARNQRHETIYELFIQEDARRFSADSAAAPGVDIGRRVTRSRPVWILRVQGWPGKQLRRARTWFRQRRGRRVVKNVVKRD